MSLLPTLFLSPSEVLLRHRAEPPSNQRRVRTAHLASFSIPRLESIMKCPTARSSYSQCHTPRGALGASQQPPNRPVPRPSNVSTAVVATALCMTACASAPGDSQEPAERVEGVEQAMSQGQGVSGTLFGYSTVRLPGCTGSIIGPRHILTATHCGSSPGQTVTFYDNSGTRVAATANINRSIAVPERHCLGREWHPPPIPPECSNSRSARPTAPT